MRAMRPFGLPGRWDSLFLLRRTMMPGHPDAQESPAGERPDQDPPVGPPAVSHKTEETAMPAASSLATSHAARRPEAALPGYFRELTAGEFDQYGEHLLRLDPQSRFTRFGGPASDEVVKAHVERLRGADLQLVGYFVDGVLRGVGELHGLPGIADSAEAAFSVERAWQGKGVGSALMDRIVRLAQQRGIVDLTIMFLAINGRMQRIVVNHFGELTRAEDEMIGHVRPPQRQSPMSWVRQLVTASLAVVDGAIDLQARLLPSSHRGW